MFNGSILVFDSNKVIYKKSFGYSNLENQTKNDFDSKFCLASVSKPFTALAIIKLEEENLISLDDRISKYLPNLPDYSSEIKIKHLLTHTSGLPIAYGLPYKQGLKNTDFLNFLKNQDGLISQPGDKFSYSNCGYVLLSLLIENITNQTFYSYMNDNIFYPMGMSNSLVYGENQTVIENRVLGYDILNNLNDNNVLTTGSGNVYSTIDDLYKWQQLFFSEKVTSNNTLNKSFEPTVLNNKQQSNYGFGWHLSDDGKNNQYIYHTGGIAGFSTSIYRDINNNSGWIILTNGGNGYATFKLNEAIKKILNNEPILFPKIPLSIVFKKLEYLHGVDSSIQMVNKLITNHPNTYYFDDTEMNEYASKHDYNESLVLFKNNIALSPNSAVSYYSLGRYYFTHEDSLNAINCFNKSLHLYPSFSPSIKYIDSLDLIIDTVLFKVNKENLKQYTGNYSILNSMSIEISYDEEQLFFKPSGYKKVALCPNSVNRFYCLEYDMEIIFEEKSLFLLINGTTRIRKEE
jgi:CubicO group peptidase (beta-lactamase class C family)